jgi:hypothetical protein
VRFRLLNSTSPLTAAISPQRSQPASPQHLHLPAASSSSLSAHKRAQLQTSWHTTAPGLRYLAAVAAPLPCASTTALNTAPEGLSTARFTLNIRAGWGVQRDGGLGLLLSPARSPAEVSCRFARSWAAGSAGQLVGGHTQGACVPGGALRSTCMATV